MHGAQMATDAELLADLLDGTLEAADVPAELAELAELAGAVSEHITLVPPTPAFRASLRDEVLQAVGGPGAGPPGSGGAPGGASGGGTVGGLGGGGATGATGAGGAVGATYAATGIPSVIAAVAATAVLATGTQAVTAQSAPGDLLYGLKQGVESLQLTIADDQRDVALLVGFATERVREAVGLADTAVVSDLLEQSERLLDDALALAVEQGRDVQELLGRYASALVTLDSRTEDPTVRAVVDRLLGEVGVSPSGRVPDVLAPGDDSDEGREEVPPDGGESVPDDATDGTGDQPADQPTDGSTAGPLDGLDDTLDELDDTLDELDDPLDGLDDPLERLEDELDDTLDELDAPLERLEDQLDDTLDDVTGTLDR